MKSTKNKSLLNETMNLNELTKHCQNLTILSRLEQMESNFTTTLFDPGLFRKHISWCNTVKWRKYYQNYWISKVYRWKEIVNNGWVHLLVVIGIKKCFLVNSKCCFRFNITSISIRMQFCNICNILQLWVWLMNQFWDNRKTKELAISLVSS